MFFFCKFKQLGNVGIYFLKLGIDFMLINNLSIMGFGKFNGQYKLIILFLIQKSVVLVKVYVIFNLYNDLYIMVLFNQNI